MRNVSVDPENRIAISQGGATWLDFDAATQAHGLVTPGGVVGSTGVTGLALGGGIGHLTAQYGLTCDNLIAAELVTPAGELVRARDDQNRELLWGLRGGGGNFGVVTAMEFKLYQTPSIYAGMMLWPWERSAELYKRWRDWTETPLLVRCELELGGVPLALFTTLTTFGTPRDITLDELAIELFYPADDATEAALRATA